MRIHRRATLVARHAESAMADSDSDSDVSPRKAWPVFGPQPILTVTRGRGGRGRGRGRGRDYDDDERRFFLQHGLTIGRDPANTVCIDNPGVARLHARVMRDDAD